MNTCEHQPSSFSTKPSKTYYKYTPLKLSPFNSKLCFLPSIFSNFQKTSNFETYGEIVIKVDMGGPGSSPCASCKLLRRRCAKECIFAPYFPPDDPHKFAIVHKVFGASNVSKMLQVLLRSHFVLFCSVQSFQRCTRSLDIYLKHFTNINVFYSQNSL